MPNKWNSHLGSIVAWITKPEDSSSQESVLPDGWLECDGRYEKLKKQKKELSKFSDPNKKMISRINC